MRSTLSHAAHADKPQNDRSYHLCPEGRVIAQVVTGRLTAPQAARQLDISRQSVYRKAHRAAAAIDEAMTPRKPGPKADFAPPHQQPDDIGDLRRENARLRQKMAVSEAVALLLTAWAAAAGLSITFAYLRLKAAQKLAMLEQLAAFVRAGGNAKVFADTVGVGYQRLLRWREGVRGLPRAEALAVLTDKSSAPPSLGFPEWVVQAILSTRRAHPSWGCRQIARHLRRRARTRIDIGKSSVAEVLRRHPPGELPERRRRSKLHTFAAKGVAVCVDFMHVQIGTTTFKVCLLIDEATRYIVGWQLMQRTSSRRVIKLLRQAMRRTGKPLLLKSDNGPEFRKSFTTALSALGIFHLNSPFYYAPFNGKIERVFRDLRRYLHYQPAVHGVWGLWRQVTVFVHEHNSLHTNAHLGAITPAEAFRRGGPASLPPGCETIQVDGDGDRLVVRFANRDGRPARRDLQLE